MASPTEAEVVAVELQATNGNLKGLADGTTDALQSQAQFLPQSDPSQASAATAKRKREDSDDGELEVSDAADEFKPKLNPKSTFSDDQPLRDEKDLIKNYFQVLQSIDVTPSILKRPLAEPSTAEEPLPKKQKSDDGAQPICIEDKVNQDAYKLLDQLVVDLKKVISDKDHELRSIQFQDGVKLDQKALAQLGNFKEKALELHNREVAYPQLPAAAAVDGSLNLDELVNKPADDKSVLTIFGQAPQGRHLFSSLPKGAAAQYDSEGAVRSLSDVQLPFGMSMTAVLPAAQAKPPARVPNLGEMFPAPPNLPPLEAPKPAKPVSKGKVLGFYHPELTDRSAYGQNKDCYYSKELTSGIWLDYSKASPPTKSPDRRRERTLSGNSEISSAVDSEVSELDTLFRGVFSSFAPEKDDSGAVIPSGELGRLWYQRQGYRYMEQLIGPELDESDVTSEVPLITPAEFEEIAEAVENWDESLVDPCLSEGDKSSNPEDKEVEETLQEISDLIETLASYQRIRHLTLPTTQNRSTTDAAKADTNGSMAAEPSDEERETYQILKDQLAVIIASLPPYAVARLNSDKLEDLNISTKIVVKSDVYKGVMEEDEASARMRHQQQQQQVAQAAQGPRQPQRAPSFHSAAPYQSGPSYNRQFQTPNQTPVPVPNYQQSPARAGVPPSYQRQVSAPMTGITPQQHRPAAGPFARPTGWNGQQAMQPLRGGYGTPSGISSFQNTPNQARAASTYQPSSGTTGRFPPSYSNYTPQQQQQAAMAAHYQQQQHSLADNAGVSPQRNTMSPSHYLNVARPPQPSMSQNRMYGTPGQPGPHPANIPRFPTNGVHSNQSPSPAPGQGSNQMSWAQLTPEQRERIQAGNRARALEQTTSFNNKMQMQQNQSAAVGVHHGVSGLGGIGISAQAPDMQKMHMRASQFGGLGGPSSPSPRLTGTASPAGMNGGGMPVPSPSPGPSLQGGGGGGGAGATPSPAPSAALGNPPTPVR